MLTVTTTAFAQPSTEAINTCQPELFLEQQSLSHLYDVRHTSIIIEAKLGSEAKCSLTAAVKNCYKSFVQRAAMYTELYQSGEELAQLWLSALQQLENTSWTYKADVGFISTQFTDVAFGDALDNELGTRSAMSGEGMWIDLNRLHSIAKDHSIWEPICILGQVSEENFKQSWSVIIKESEERKARTEALNREKMAEESDLFGAIAHGSNKEQIGVSFGRKTREEAESEALNKCGYNCSVRVSFMNGCGAYSQGQTRGWGAMTGASDTEAADASMAECSRQSNEVCRVRATVCTNGFVLMQ